VTTKKATLALLGVLALSLVVGSVELGSRAAFSDAEVCIGNTFTDPPGPISIVKVSGDGSWDGRTWLVGMYASETRATTVTLANSLEEDIAVTLTVSPQTCDNGNLSFGFDNPAPVIPAKGRASVVFRVEASQGVTPGSYSNVVTIEW